MRRKNLFLAITAVLMIFAWSGAAFAANTITVNVTSEPIHYHATSDKGGGFTLTFDAGTVISAGDQITVDLTYGVTLARAINIYIGQGGATTPWTAIPTAGAPIIYTGTAPAYGGGGVYFHVYGTAGTQRITVDVLNTGGSLTVPGAAGVDSLILSFLGQRTNAADFTTPGIYSSGTTAATLGENTLCINVSAYDGTVVRGSMDSAADKYLFVPSDPEIAHVITALNIAFDECKGRSTGFIEIGSRLSQATPTCDAFDNEDGDGYCSSTHSANSIVLASSNAFDQADYQVRLDILVNGVGGDNGVYWSNETVYGDGFDSDPACTTASLQAIGTQSSYTYYYGSGSSGAVPANPSSNDCDLASTERAVSLLTDADDLGLTTTNDYLQFDMPALNYDLDDITAGDVVSVQITVTKVPCGNIFVGIWEIGTFGCASAPAMSGLLFPYFTPIGASVDQYWDGIVITNPGATAGSALITVFEADGDQGNITVSIPARSQYVNLLSAIAFAQTVGTGSLGDSSCYVRVNVTGVSGIDGFGMMARQDTGESMGYLPRQMSF
jgi:hypothetical protein